MNKLMIAVALGCAVGFTQASGADLFSGQPAKKKANPVKPAQAPTAAQPSAPAQVNSIQFLATQDGSQLKISSSLFDTPESREFLSSGKNPYVGRQDAADRGKKLFQMYSCTQCHGGNGQGAVGPNLLGPDFRYPKNATNKGMFETIWNGTNGGMGAKGKGLMDPTDSSNGLAPDEVLKIEAWLRSSGKLTGNE